jgi:hypothetical protein
MTIRSASLLAAAALAAATAPALAQDRGYDPGPPPPLPAWDDEWEEYPDDEYGDDEDVREHHRDRAGHPGMRGHGPRHPMGYPLEHRAAGSSNAARLTTTRAAVDAARSLAAFSARWPVVSRAARLPKATTISAAL